jgi:hypothetical protein
LSEFVIAVHRFDLATAALLAEQRGARLLVVDPVMHGRTLAQGLPAPLLYSRLNAAVAHGAAAQARAATLGLSRALGALLDPLVPGAAAAAWSTHRFNQLFWTAIGYREIWHELLDQQSASHWHVLLPRQPHCYGTHSFVPGLMLIEQLQRRDLAHTAYGFDCPGLDEAQLPDLRRLPYAPELLCHVPTCFHDAAYLDEEIRASGLRCGVLSAQVYDTELPGLPASGLIAASEVAQLLEPGQLARVQALANPVQRVLSAHLQPMIAQRAFLDTQVAALWQALQAQCLLYLWLEQHYAAHPPRQLLLSNHDATVHGALLSFAHTHRLAVTVMPHSKINNQAVPVDGLTPLCLHHGLQDGPSLDWAGRSLPALRLLYPGSWHFDPERSQGLETVGVVLNGLSANGMCMLNFEQYLDGLRELQRWAQALGIRLRWRIRAAENPLLLLAETLQLSADELAQDGQGSLLEFAQGCDLCLGYDVPTSGLHELLRHGVAVLQAEIRPLARSDWSIVDARVAPRHSLPELLDRLHVMKANPAEFRDFRRRQHRAAQDSQQGAQPLRHWLAQQQQG